jgi:hypothetical protein
MPKNQYKNGYTRKIRRFKPIQTPNFVHFDNCNIFYDRMQKKNRPPIARRAAIYKLPI